MRRASSQKSLLSSQIAKAGTQRSLILIRPLPWYLAAWFSSKKEPAPHTFTEQLQLSSPRATALGRSALRCEWPRHSSQAIDPIKGAKRRTEATFINPLTTLDLRSRLLPVPRGQPRASTYLRYTLAWVRAFQTSHMSVRKITWCPKSPVPTPLLGERALRRRDRTAPDRSGALTARLNEYGALAGRLAAPILHIERARAMEFAPNHRDSCG
jgi:hypothetical protein